MAKRDSYTLPPELQPTVEIEQAGTRLLGDRRRSFTVLAAFLLLSWHRRLLPKVVGMHDGLNRLGDPSWGWIAVAVGFNAVSFLAYAALFRGVLGGRVGEERSLMSGLSTSARPSRSRWRVWRPPRLFSAAGAGGVALTDWVLRKAGMERRQAASRMVAFIVLLYSAYAARADRLRRADPHRRAERRGRRWPARSFPRALRWPPVPVIVGCLALIPGDLERRLARLEERPGAARRLAKRLATVPATIATGVRIALSNLRHPREGRPRHRWRAGLLGRDGRGSCGPASTRSVAGCRSASW